MFEILLVVIGILIGWNIPQPTIIKNITDNIVSKFNEWRNKE